MKLNVKAFALACGIIWGIGLFVATWWIMLLDVSEATTAMANSLGDFYIGYSVTAIGSFVGLIWGFLDALVGGAILAFLYNLLAERF